MNGRELRQAREARGQSKAALARAWGVSPRMIYKLEKGGELPANYANPATQLAGGRIATPRRRKTSTGKVAKVRGKGGRVVTPKTGANVGRGGVSFDSRGTQRAVIFVPDGRGRRAAAGQVRAELAEAARQGKVATVTGYADPAQRVSTGEIDINPRARRDSLDTIIDTGELDDGSRYGGLHGAPGIFVTIIY